MITTAFARALLITVCCSPTVFADIIYSGDTTGGPTFIRPQNFTSIRADLGPIAYHSQPFHVSTAGQYILEVTSLAPFTHSDPYAFVYSGFFNPSQPLQNLIAGDDDYAGVLTILGTTAAPEIEASRIALGEADNFGGIGTGLLLQPNTQYIAVISGFSPADAGTFNAGIGDGPGGGQVSLGSVAAVPEPSAAVACLMCCVAFYFRNRRQQASGTAA